MTRREPTDTAPASGMAWAPTVAGVVASIATLRTSQVLWLAGAQPGAAGVIVGIIIFFIGAALSAYLMGASRWIVALAFLAGIAVGVLIDAIIDSMVFSRDRNLFPIEIVLWWLIGIVPITIGVFIGRAMRRKGI